jgi:hypothetical protein
MDERYDNGQIKINFSSKAMKNVFLTGIFLASGIFATVSANISDHKTACLQQKGHAYLCGTYWTYSSDEFWNSSGDRRDAHNEFEKSWYTLYAEYGVTRWDTATLKMGWGRVEESLNGRTFGFEDVEIGWKRQMGKKWDHWVAAEIIAIIPVEKEYKSGVRYGCYGGEINLLFTKGFLIWNKCGNYDLRLGYRGYDDFPADQLRADAVFNLKPFSKLTITLAGFLDYGFNNGKSRDDESFFLYHPNYRLLRSEIQATYNIYKGASVFIGYNQHLWGQNAGTNGGAYGGAQIQF